MTTGETSDAVVSVEVDDRGVAVVEFGRGRSNYFDAVLIGKIADAYAELAADRARAIVLCSAGRHFCAGLDFGDARDVEATVAAIYRQGLRLFAAGPPVVAAVQGAAIGGGLGLAMSADFRVGAPDARLAANFARIGIHHGFGLSVTLARAVGRQRAAGLLLSGRTLDGREAGELGLFDRVSESADSLRAEAVAWAGEIARCAPLAVASIRRTLRGSDLAEQVDAALAHELAEQVALMRTDDFAEGVRAAQERREPEFHVR
ncbi:enoyl-CoA hydratase/isomerase family protein [Nocardioides humi]|uniref:Enoyl-CoA hydratase/isomerase family protein n=1 Tax=Nocardioides humi TaxID=449461 RepID=A0ABN2BZX7_9ACTN|nr:enoyl-CoA hydratase/isomerase family protein [Nocardioides humi]